MIRKVFLCLTLLYSYSSTVPLKAMYLPLDAEERRSLVKFCDEYPYIAYPLLGAQLVCGVILVSATIKQYCGPTISSCFSCCRSPKQQKENSLANSISEGVKYQWDHNETLRAAERKKSAKLTSLLRQLK